MSKFRQSPYSVSNIPTLVKMEKVVLNSAAIRCADMSSRAKRRLDWLKANL